MKLVALFSKILKTKTISELNDLKNFSFIQENAFVEAIKSLNLNRALNTLPLVQGGDIINFLNISPSPIIGKIIKTFESKLIFLIFFLLLLGNLTENAFRFQLRNLDTTKEEILNYIKEIYEQKKYDSIKMVVSLRQYNKKKNEILE